MSMALHGEALGVHIFVLFYGLDEKFTFVHEIYHCCLLEVGVDVCT